MLYKSPHTEIYNPTSTLLYPVSLLIGCWDWVQGGNPLYAAVKCLSGRRGQIWPIFFIFLQKAHGTPIPYMEFFWRGPQIFFAPSNRAFFRGTDPFQKLRAQAVRGARALLLLLMIIPTVRKYPLAGLKQTKHLLGRSNNTQVLSKTRLD